MADEPLKPLPHDPSRVQVKSMLDLAEEQDTNPWLFAAEGEYHTYVVEAFKRDGSGRQTLVAIEWPGRIRNTDDRVTVRVLIDPEDALGLFHTLADTLMWLDVARRMGN